MRYSHKLVTKVVTITTVFASFSCTPNGLSVFIYAANLKHLNLWNLNFCVDTVKLTQVDVTNGKEKEETLIGGYAIITDDLFVFYTFGVNIYLYFISKRISKQIATERSQIKSISSAGNGFLVATVDEIVLYHDDKDNFYTRSNISLENYSVLKLFPLVGGLSLGYTDNGTIVQINCQGNSLEVTGEYLYNWEYKFQCQYQDIVFLTTTANSIKIFDLCDKRHVKTFLEESPLEITCMSVNSSAHNLFLGTADSKVLIYEIFELDIILQRELFLSENAIVGIHLTKSYIICEDDQGSFFVVNCENYEILTYISYQNVFLKFIPLDDLDSDKLQLYFFEYESKNSVSSNLVQIFEYNRINNKTRSQVITLPFPVTSVTYSKERKRFIVNPLLSRQLKSLSFDPENGQVLVEDLPYKSPFKYNQIQAFNNLIMLYGLGGEIVFMDSLGQEVSRITAAHRLNGQIVNVLTCPHSIYMLATDSELNLICLKTNFPPEPRIFIRQPTICPTVVKSEMSWLESRQNKNLQSELQNNKQICQEIHSHMAILRQEVYKLLEKNISRPEDEKLVLQEFNLNDAQLEMLHNQEAHSADLETKKKMMAHIEQLKTIHQWLRDNCWTVMDVKSTTINGIFSQCNVENFALIYPDGRKNDELRNIIARHQIEQLTAGDVFQPFAPIDTNKLERMLSQEPNCEYPTEIQPVFWKRTTDKSGTKTMQFITSLFDRYHQMEVVSYQQCHTEEILGYFDVLYLKEYFNTKFNDLQNLKASLLGDIRVKNERLRLIQRELNDLSRLSASRKKYQSSIVDPEFTIEEQPERITVVTDEEMSSRPFQIISERTQHSDDLSDDEDLHEPMFNCAFRDKCLQTMMAGVLEIRWEDEIKKTPTIPVALKARKDLRDYDEHDFRAVKEYEDKLKYLGEEREKYRNMLEMEKQQLETEYENMKRSFNSKLCALIDLKIEVEMAVNQENFKLLRNREFNRKRLDFNDKEGEIKALMLSIKKEISSLTNVIHEFDKKIQECKSISEIAETRDRQLDKQFKNNFAEVSSHAIVDQAFKFFK